MSSSFLLSLGSGVKIDKDSMLQCICSVKDQTSGTQGSAECVAYVLITFCDLSVPLQRYSTMESIYSKR